MRCACSQSITPRVHCASGWSEAAGAGSAAACAVPVPDAAEASPAFAATGAGPFFNGSVRGGVTRRPEDAPARGGGGVGVAWRRDMGGRGGAGNGTSTASGHSPDRGGEGADTAASIAAGSGGGPASAAACPDPVAPGSDDRVAPGSVPSSGSCVAGAKASATSTPVSAAGGGIGLPPWSASGATRATCRQSAVAMCHGDTGRCRRWAFIPGLMSRVVGVARPASGRPETVLIGCTASPT